MRWQPSGSVRVVAAAVAAAALAACGQMPQPGVGVRSLATELVFGVAPAPAAVPPANMSLSPERPAGMVITSPAGPRTVPPPVPGEAPMPDCPQAGPTDFPDQPASTAPAGRPAQGVYRWMVQGHQHVNEIGTVPLPATTHRRIRDVIELGDGAFSYVSEERELALGSTTVVSNTYEIVPRDRGRTEAGMYLTRIERRSPQGTREFQPTPPILVLPFPVRIGQSPIALTEIERNQITGVGIDIRRLEVLRHSGSVVGRERIDACGTVVDSWLVEAVQEYVSATGQVYRRAYDYAVAPQLGALIVHERVQTPCTTRDDDGTCDPEPEFVMSARLGQLDPGDPPDGDDG